LDRIVCSGQTEFQDKRKYMHVENSFQCSRGVRPYKANNTLSNLRERTLRDVRAK